MNIHLLTDYELSLLDLVKKALTSGDSVTEVMESWEILDALQLLVKLANKQ